MTTIRDIARQAKVSVGTVSNYLNNPSLLAEGTRSAIKDAIDVMGYHPRAAARSLKSRQTHRIGLVPLISLEDNHSVDPGDMAFLEFISAANTAATENGYDILLAAATSPTDEARIYERLIGEMQVDGLILMGMRAVDERVKLLLSRNFPFVTYGQTAGTARHAFVDVDGAAGIQAAVHHLHELGHRRIAYLKPTDGMMLSVQRWQGFTRAMAECGLAVEEQYMAPGGFNAAAGEAAAQQLLSLPVRPTAIIASNDFSAFGVLTVIQAHGLRPGLDVSVVGFDDIRFAAHWQPALTTVAQPFRRIGFETVRALVTVMSGSQALPQVCIEPRLVVRQSTGPAPG